MSQFMQYRFCSSAKGLDGRFTSMFCTEEDARDFNAAAERANLTSQRYCDETRAKRAFGNAIDWIDFIEKTKGQSSGRRLDVIIAGPRGRESAIYTQSRQYHCTGGEDLILRRDGTWGCEEVTVDQHQKVSNAEDEDPYETDRDRARLLEAVVATVKQKSNIGSLENTGADKAIRLGDLPYNIWAAAWVRQAPSSSTADHNVDVHRPAHQFEFIDNEQIRILRSEVTLASFPTSHKSTLPVSWSSQDSSLPEAPIFDGQSEENEQVIEIDDEEFPDIVKLIHD